MQGHIKAFAEVPWHVHIVVGDVNLHRKVDRGLSNFEVAARAEQIEDVYRCDAVVFAALMNQVQKQEYE